MHHDPETGCALALAAGSATGALIGTALAFLAPQVLFVFVVLSIAALVATAALWGIVMVSEWADVGETRF